MVPGQEVTLGELYRLLESLTRTIHEIHVDVKGQTREIASLQSRIAVLEASAANAKDMPARWGNVLTGAGTVGAWLYMVFHR